MSDAVVVINVNEVGGDVVATATGNLDLSSLAFSLNGVPIAIFVGATPDIATFAIGGGATFDVYSNAAGPAAIGPGAIQVAPTFSSGDFVGNGGSPILYDVWVPSGYVSGAPLNGSSTWVGNTFAGIGLTPGTYQYTWASDSITLNIGPVAAVPEASTYVMAGFSALALGGLVYLRRKRGNMVTATEA